MIEKLVCGLVVMTSNRITKPCRSTLYALSVCMNGRASHFVMQTAIAYSATDGGVILSGRFMQELSVYRFQLSVNTGD